MGLEVIAAAAVVSAAASVAGGAYSYVQGQEAANAQKDLAAQQAAQLKSQQDAADAQAAAQATTGQSFGLDDRTTRALSTGFGGGGGGSANSGRGQITGMG